MQGVVPVLVRVGARAVATSLFSADLMSLPFPYTLTLVLIVKVHLGICRALLSKSEFVGEVEQI